VVSVVVSVLQDPWLVTKFFASWSYVVRNCSFPETKEIEMSISNWGKHDEQHVTTVDFWTQHVLDFWAVASGIYLQEVDPMLESQSFYI
jgi:hypothetical protein